MPMIGAIVAIGLAAGGAYRCYRKRRAEREGPSLRTKNDFDQITPADSKPIPVIAKSVPPDDRIESRVVQDMCKGVTAAAERYAAQSTGGATRDRNPFLPSNDAPAVKAQPATRDELPAAKASGWPLPQMHVASTSPAASPVAPAATNPSISATRNTNPFVPVDPRTVASACKAGEMVSPAQIELHRDEQTAATAPGATHCRPANALSNHTLPGMASPPADSSRVASALPVCNAPAAAAVAAAGSKALVACDEPSKRGIRRQLEAAPADNSPQDEPSQGFVRRPVTRSPTVNVPGVSPQQPPLAASSPQDSASADAEPPRSATVNRTLSRIRKAASSNGAGVSTSEQIRMKGETRARMLMAQGVPPQADAEQSAKPEQCFERLERHNQLVRQVAQVQAETDDDIEAGESAVERELFAAAVGFPNMRANSFSRPRAEAPPAAEAKFV